MQLTDYLALIRERLVLVVLVIAGTAATAALLFGLQSPAYEASVRVRALPPAPFSPSNEVLQEEQTDLGTEAELVRSITVAQEVIDELGLDVEPDALLEQIATGVTPNTAVLVVQARASERDLAVNLANTFAEEYLQFRRRALTETIESQTRRIEGDLAAALQRLTELEQLSADVEPGSAGDLGTTVERQQLLAEIGAARQALSVLADRQAIQEGFGEVIQPAVDARTVRSTSLPRSAVFGVLIGVPLALAVVLLLDSLNRTVRTQADAERATGAQLLGLIPLDEQWNDPREPRLATRTAPLSAAAEAYRTLAHNLSKTSAWSGATSLLFTSPGDGDGKTSVVSNTAVALAEAGRRTTLIDADLRNPRLHAFLDIPRQPGLADGLSDRTELASMLREIDNRLRVLPAGRSVERPDALVVRTWSSGFTGRLTDEEERRRPLRARASAEAVESIAPTLVLVDSPPLLGAAETSTLAAAADGVVLVVRAGLTSRQDATSAARQVRQAGGQLTGVVLIGGRVTDEVPLHDAAPGFVHSRASTEGSASTAAEHV